MKNTEVNNGRESVYGSFVEYSDLKQVFFVFSDLVLNRKKGKRYKQINSILFVLVCFVCSIAKCVGNEFGRRFVVSHY